MSQTTWSGPLASGDRQAGVSDGPNVGVVALRQVIDISADDTLVQDGTIYLPANSQIIALWCDFPVAYDSATSATLTVGTESGDDTYIGGINAKTAIRTQGTATRAQLLAKQDIGTDRAVVATVTSVGQPTAGRAIVTVLYAQTTAED